jgi:hypothetical protein
LIEYIDWLTLSLQVSRQENSRVVRGVGLGNVFSIKICLAWTPDGRAGSMKETFTQGQLIHDDVDALTCVRNRVVVADDGLEASAPAAYGLTSSMFSSRLNFTHN